ncbi:MAG: universal stress protein [Polyangiaceae bacterium]
MLINLSAILVPVDFSSGSQFFVEYATAMARTFHATVTLMHVCHNVDSMNGIVPGADKAADDKEDLAIARKALDDLRAATLKPMNTPMSVLVVHGSPADKINSTARAFQMIVMGTHGRTGLRRFLMGTVAEAVVRRAPCPVLTIHFPSPDGIR